MTNFTRRFKGNSVTVKVIEQIFKIFPQNIVEKFRATLVLIKFGESTSTP